MSVQPITHETVALPAGVRPARFRPPSGASDAPTVSLDGQWRFRLFPEASTGASPTDPGTDPADTWDLVPVPGHWQLAGAPDAWPYGTPAYTNVLFPIPLDPPRVPRDNPTGEYRRVLEVPAEWAATPGRTVLRFEGVDSWFEVSLNGTVLAQSHGSRLPTEIDVTDHLSPGENLLAVRVTQWSAFTYVEDQDQWWLSGIFRSVSLERRPDGGVDHVEVSAEYDDETGEGVLRIEALDVDGAPVPARVLVPELGIDVASGTLVRALVEPWSAELPRLYEATVSTAAETVDLRLGFRTVSIEDGVFRVNGRPVVLRGVNRHEFEPTLGRAVTREAMLQDVLAMKRLHVNAVRTSHYPPHPHFLDLCDLYGLYVIDENDLETHGFIAVDWRGNPTDDPAWTDVLVDRVTRMVRRDAHHPSIVMWSLGNEAGTGRNLGAMAAAIRELDPSRPLHYEGDWTCEYTDVYSRMYAGTPEVARIGRGQEPPLPDAELDARRRALPFLECEYAHAMGNGPGGLSDYDDLFDAHPRLMGGFIWEWKDHGIARRPDHGSGDLFYGYGGDFGEVFHDGTFIADGLLFPDRTPSPGMVEAAAVFAPVRIDPISLDDDDADADRLLVRNRYVFRDTGHVALRWVLHQGGEVLESGEIDAEVLAPGEQLLLAPPSELVELADTAGGAAPVWWTVRAVQTVPGVDAAWVEDGFELGVGQLRLRGARPVEPEPAAAPLGVFSAGLTIGPARFDAAGRLVALGGIGVPTIRVDAWRASTDNDHARQWEAERSEEDTWSLQGLALLAERVDDAEIVEDALVVRGRVAGPATDCGFAFTQTWRQAGPDAVDLDLTIVPEGRWLGSVPRLGLLLGLEEPDAGDVALDWCGLGPGESYADSAKAALGGAWSHTVAQWQTPYTHPQENGARRGVTSAALRLSAGRTLTLTWLQTQVGAREVEGFELTARPWSDAALHRAAHPGDLVPDGTLWLHLDAASHGVGSAACGPGVLPNATLHPAPARLRVRLALSGDDSR